MKMPKWRPRQTSLRGTKFGLNVRLASAANMGGDGSVVPADPHWWQHADNGNM